MKFGPDPYANIFAKKKGYSYSYTKTSTTTTITTRPPPPAPAKPKPIEQPKIEDDGLKRFKDID